MCNDCGYLISGKALVHKRLYEEQLLLEFGVHIPSRESLRVPRESVRLTTRSNGRRSHRGNLAAWTGGGIWNGSGCAFTCCKAC